MTQRILTGMMFHFPNDSFPDASGVLLALFEIMPQEVAIWVKRTIEMLPAGTIKAGEGERLMNAIGQKIQAGETRKVRVLLQGTAERAKSRQKHLNTNSPYQISRTRTAGEMSRPEKDSGGWRLPGSALVDRMDNHLVSSHPNLAKYSLPDSSRVPFASLQ